MAVLLRIAIAKRVREEMQRRNWSIKKTAEAARVQRVDLRRMLKRSRPIPAVNLVLLAREMGTTVEELAGVGSVLT